MNRRQTTRQVIDTSAELAHDGITTAAKVAAGTATDALKWATGYILSLADRKRSREALYMFFDSLAEETIVLLPTDRQSIFSSWASVPGNNHLFPASDSNLPEHKLRVGIHGYGEDNDGGYLWLPSTYLAAERAEGPTVVNDAPLQSKLAEEPVRTSDAPLQSKKDAISRARNHWVGAEFVCKEELANMTPEAAVAELIAYSMHLGAYVTACGIPRD
jgi:hypothetical protein